MDRIHRVTMFKMAKEEHRRRLLEQYSKLAVDHKRDGKPYIVNVTVGPAEKHNLSQGYTVVCKTEFASMDDMKYYEDECAAHGEIKTLMGTLECDGVLTVYFRPTATGGTSQGI